MKLVLQQKQPEKGGAVSFFWQGEGAVHWQAGQYGVYKLPHEHPDNRKDRRFFTISAAPFELNPRTTTRISPKGSTFKSALDHLKVGDAIELLQVGGDFVMADPTAQHIFIAGGIGITPFRSILKQLDHAGQKLNVTLLYANRDPESVVFKTELEELATRHPEFKLQYVLEPKRVDAELINAVAPDLTSPIFWISGPEPMVEGVEEMLKKLNVPEGHIKTDYFPGYNWP